ncbi:Hypothetical predicted protein [Cloeon dipterum]|uniref:Ubiquinol-cytochrome c chaperone domain-containing protein n=1 Tax=Cloeon dipterum TaxID=197152 RepID=A0A8S1C124_9INSE|nr:Hypothetical predicted protein [Cloeon dipterum]
MIRSSLRLYHTSRLLRPMINRNTPALGTGLIRTESFPTRFKSSIPVASEKPEQVQENPGFLKRVAQKLFHTSRGKYIALGVLLYEKCANEPNFIEFIKVLELPDTFNSWFLMTELHVWMVMTKCIGLENNGRHMRNAMVKTLWDDCSDRMKKLQVPRRGAVLQTLDHQLRAAVFAYDEGIMTSDVVLASALWRRLYSDDSADIKSKQLEILVSYVRRQIEELHKISDEEFTKRPSFKWVSLKE